MYANMLPSFLHNATPSTFHGERTVMIGPELLAMQLLTMRGIPLIYVTTG